jgi:dienelactone hydrolase
MSKTVWCLIASFGLMFTCPALASGPELWGDLAQGYYGVGFRLMEEKDPSRSFQGRARPVRIYLWYPAAKTTGPAMSFRDYAGLSAGDFGGNQGVGVIPQGIDPSLPIVRALSKEGLARLMGEKLRAVHDAEPEEKQFPLIVFGQGIDFESPLTHLVLCEYLASHGYVVATSPLRGVHSRLSGVEVLDVEAQVRDMEFTWGRVRRLPFVDQARTGLAGFDLGGISALLMQMRNPEVDALATLDCAILFESQLSVPHQSPDFNPDRLRVPWLHMISAIYVRRDLPDLQTRSLFARAKYSDSYLVFIDDVEHANFTGYSMMKLERPLPGWRPFKQNAGPVYETVCRYVRHFFDAHLRGDRAAMAFLEKEPKDNAPAGVSFSVKRKKGTSPAPSTADDLINTLFGKGLDQALRQARSAPAEEAVLNLTAYKVLRWGNSDWALELFKLNVALYPESTNTHDSLGDAYAARSELDKAIECYRKALTLDPDAQHSKAKLNRLERQQQEPANP